MHWLKLEKVILIKNCEESMVRIEFKPKHEPEIDVIPDLLDFDNQE